ncbi:hypothetical protein KKA02_01335 [Patescibacteria group bacterium]|nr:hypothetical protein [Patescibacteria group bacterium]
MKKIIKWGLISFVALIVIGVIIGKGKKEVLDKPNYSEPKTEKFVKEKAEKYWDTISFKDHSAKYEFMCEEVKSSVSKEKYIQKYKEEDSVPLEKVEILEVRIEDNIAYIKTVGYNFFYQDGMSGMTEMRYENDKWCKVLSEETIEWLSAY